MVSVPARNKDPVPSPVKASSGRRYSSPRSKSPARGAGNENAGVQPPHGPSLSQSSSCKANQSSYPDNPMAELDENAIGNHHSIGITGKPQKDALDLISGYYSVNLGRPFEIRLQCLEQLRADLQYKLPEPLSLLRADNNPPPWRPGLKEIFDAIVCDPPYGVCAHGRKSGGHKLLKSPYTVSKARTTFFTLLGGWLLCKICVLLPRLAW